eukprot:UN24274
MHFEFNGCHQKDVSALRWFGGMAMPCLTIVHLRPVVAASSVMFSLIPATQLDRALSLKLTIIQKQAKNRNETGSNLSLGTRLTVLSKRLGRKRCCDATPDRCLECNCVTILTAHC